MKVVKKTVASRVVVMVSWLLLPGCAQIAPIHGLDSRGLVDVYALRTAVAQLESIRPATPAIYCESASGCQTATDVYEKKRAEFMETWGKALLKAIANGDEVAEVIWRQCKTTPVIDRRALASTCDEDWNRRNEAVNRLKQIGFEAALETHQQRRNPNEPNTIHQEQHLREMRTGVFGRQNSDSYMGGNSAKTPDDIDRYRRWFVIRDAHSLVPRAFTFSRMFDSHDDQAIEELRINRQPLPAENGFTRNAAFHSDGVEIFLLYDRHRKTMVGGAGDARFLSMLHDTLAQSEQRIDYWLKRDPRWSIFLIRRNAYGEWVPDGMVPMLARLDPSWEGEWILEKTFADFVPTPFMGPNRARIRAHVGEPLMQFMVGNRASYTCKLRYSGAISRRLDSRQRNESPTAAIDQIVEIVNAPSPRVAASEALAPLNIEMAYKQVLVICPDHVVSDYRSKASLFLANDVMVEVFRSNESDALTINHWRRIGPLDTNAVFESSIPRIDINPFLNILSRLYQVAAAEDERKAKAMELARAKYKAARNADEMIDTLAYWRLEKFQYDPDSEFPPNLVSLIRTPNISIKLCKRYTQLTEDPVVRFNYMVVINRRVVKGTATPDELVIIPDCLRLAFDDDHPWVRAEALDAFRRFAEEKDRAKLTKLLNDGFEDVRIGSQNALNRIEPPERQR